MAMRSRKLVLCFKNISPYQCVTFSVSEIRPGFSFISFNFIAVKVNLFVRIYPFITATVPPSCCLGAFAFGSTPDASLPLAYR